MARQIWTAHISHARLTLSPFSSEQMAEIGSVMIDKIKDRIQQAIDVNDNQAKDLNPRYAKRKMAYGSAPVRDWTFTGRTLGSLKVKNANENQVRIGFINAQADMSVSIQNRRNRLWGTSPSDEKVLHREVDAQLMARRMIRMVKVA